MSEQKINIKMVHHGIGFSDLGKI